MEHTEYYHLSLWEQDDLIQMEDFNSNNAKIDAALAEKAAAATVTAQISALQGAMPKIATGTYTGNKSTITVTTGFAPKFLIVITTGTNYGADILGAVGVSGFMLAVKRSDSNAVYTNCTFGSTGFIITDSSDRNLNANGMTYRYIAVG